MAETSADTFTAPYISFAQLQSVLDRMNTEGVPSRMDRSYLGSWSGASQSQFLAAARALDLIDEHKRPTSLFKALATEPDRRPELVRALLEDKYARVLALDKTATQQQLEEVLRDMGTSGATTRKAATFFLHAADFAGIEVSTFFKSSRASSSGSRSTGTRRRARPQRAREPDPGTVPQADTDPKARYIDLLLKKAEQADGDLDTNLLDRIERVIGVEAATAPKENQD